MKLIFNNLIIHILISFYLLLGNCLAEIEEINDFSKPKIILGLDFVGSASLIDTENKVSLPEELVNIKFLEEQSTIKIKKVTRTDSASASMYFFFIICLYSIFVALFLSKYFKKNKFDKNDFIKNESRYYINIYIIFAVLLILILGLRGNEDEYSRIFLRIPTFLSLFDTGQYPEIVLWPLIKEKGLFMILIMSFIKSINAGSQLFFFIYVGIAITLNAYFFKKFTVFYPMAFLFYISHGLVHKEWVGMRMALISALLLAIIYFIASNKKFYAWILLIISVLNHYIAIVSVSLFYLNRRISSRLMVSILIVVLLLTVFNIQEQLMNFSNIKSILPSFIADYIGSEYYGYNVGLLHPKGIQQIIVLMLILIFVHDKKPEINNDRYYNLIINTYFISTMLMFLLSFSAIFSYRFGSYFYAVEPIVLTYFISHLRFKKMIIYAVICFSLLIAFYNYSYKQRLSEYHFLIDNYEIENDNRKIMNEIENNQLKF